MEECNNEINKRANDVAGSTPEPRRRVLRVWIVDDHPELRDLMAQLLTQQPGFKCTRQFPSAEALLETLAVERPPDMVLLDINLKGRSGLSAIRPIREAAPTVKVVMMTTFSNSHYEVEAFHAGASAFVLKSYELGDILRVLREADRRPGDPALFPNLKYHTPAAPPVAARSTPANPVSLLGALQQLCRLGRRKATG